MAKRPHPAADFEIEAADILAERMRHGKKMERLFSAAALLIAAALQKNGKTNGN